MQCFDRCGLASLDDFETSDYRALFATLEAEQVDFLAHESEFRTGSYAWERDPLHGWSRCWEYPYAFYHLKKWREATANSPMLLDVGSGVTFFPFCLARRSCAVICIDSDPIAQAEIERAAVAVTTSPGSVSFCLADATQLPLSDCQADAAYCISVLEHTADPAAVAAEIARVLRPGGFFVLTVDVDLLGTTAIGPTAFSALSDELSRHFEPAAAEKTVHPRRMLESFNSPYARARQRQVPGLMWRTREGKLLPLVGGPIAAEPLRLACYGAVLRRLPAA